MKKRNRAAFVLMAAVLLTACGRTADTAVTTEEIVVPEMSSKDILVNSLEYLLEEETEEEQTQEEAVHKETQRQEDTDPQMEAVICYGRDLHSDLTRETILVSEITPEVLLNALARHNIVPLLDTRVLSMEEKEQDGKKVLYLDLSEAFGEYMRTMSKDAECIIAASVVNTFLANYKVDAIYITVEGETLETANTVYTEAIFACTPMEVRALLMTEDAGETGEE